jgi:anti-anti-sigma factor
MTPDHDPLDGFGISVIFDGGRVVLGVRGEVDIVTAPELAAILGAVIGRGHLAVVLDLAALDFMDASGLGVIASGASSLDSVGGELAICSAPAQVTRILEITGLTSVVHFEPALERSAPGPELVSSEQSARAPDRPLTAAAGDLAGHLRRVAAVPADHDVVDGALRLVVALAQATVEGADGVSVSLQRHGRLTTVAATDQTVLDMDADQYASGEGPCVSASAEGRGFHVESLDEENRWPTFIPQAQKLGINAIVSSPLTAQDRPVGALNIYSRTRAAFSEKEQRLAAVFAAEASIILGDAVIDVSEDQLSARVQDALEARRIIAQAEGVVMEREGISTDDAYTLLVNFSRRTGQPVIERAADLVDSTRRPQPHPSETKDAL